MDHEAGEQLICLRIRFSALAKHEAPMLPYGRRSSSALTTNSSATDAD